MFDIERGNVIGQEHNFIGEELLAVHAGQIATGHAAQQVHDKVTSARASELSGH
jgi:hypothetical protein